MTTTLELQHFAVLEVSYLHKTASIIITCTTNNPVHLTLYYTDKEPVRHTTSRILRGLALPWGAYWCFVAWNSVEQQEPGDTLIHTFEVPDWAYCQTKYLAFRGTVAAVLSPSVTALIKHHHSGVSPLTKFESYEINWDVRTGILVGYQGAQTFTPQQYHLISSVHLLMSRSVPTWPTLTIDIKEAPDDIPIGPVLTSGSISAVHLTTDGAGSWVEIPLPLYLLVPGHKYAIIARSDATTAAQLFWHADITDPTYLRGIALYSNDGGLTWNKLPPKDFMFQEYGYY